MIVSQKIRDMIEGMACVTHHFIPLELMLKNGTQVRDRFLFVAGDRIDGIIAGESKVSPQFFEGKLGLCFAPSSPKIVWRADAIAARAIWVDRYLPNNIVICDELEEAFQKAGIRHYRKTLSPWVIGAGQLAVVGQDHSSAGNSRPTSLQAFALHG